MLSVIHFMCDHNRLIWFINLFNCAVSMPPDRYRTIIKPVLRTGIKKNDGKMTGMPTFTKFSCSIFCMFYRISLFSHKNSHLKIYIYTYIYMCTCPKILLQTLNAKDKFDHCYLHVVSSKCDFFTIAEGERRLRALIPSNVVNTICFIVVPC